MARPTIGDTPLDSLIAQIVWFSRLAAVVEAAVLVLDLVLVLLPVLGPCTEVPRVIVLPLVKDGYGVDLELYDVEGRPEVAMMESNLWLDCLCTQ